MDSVQLTRVNEPRIYLNCLQHKKPCLLSFHRFKHSFHLIRCFILVAMSRKITKLGQISLERVNDRYTKKKESKLISANCQLRNEFKRVTDEEFYHDEFDTKKNTNLNRYPKNGNFIFFYLIG